MGRTENHVPQRDGCLEAFGASSAIDYLQREQAARGHSPRAQRLRQIRNMTKIYKRLVYLALLGMVAGFGFTASQAETSFAQAATRPNILFVLTDDMNFSDLRYMPKTRRLLADQGTRFTNAFVTNSLCCPSRATILRGQYSHNHKIWGNFLPIGGFQKFRDLGREKSTIAAWLDNPNNFADRVDYDTVLIGKYLNGYDDTTYVPPGWDRWHAYLGYYEASPTTYRINENGRINSYDLSRIHDTDLFARKAARFLRNTAGGAPFFLYLSTNAPHTPAYVPNRHQGMFSDLPLPKPPSFDEADVSDKPAWVREKPRLTQDRVDYVRELYRKRLRSLQSVDEMVGRLVNVLRDTGELSNTYIVFTSDNGYHLGEHRLEAKATAYEEAIRAPLLVRGPGVPRGVNRSQMALNNDFAPTFASWAGITPPNFVDGRSLRPLLSARPPSSWRSALLVEHRRSNYEGPFARLVPNYDAVRTANHLYVEYKTGERELYDLGDDPYELRSRHRTASSELKRRLASRLDELRGCAAAGCRSAEN
jgi:N-acetylglucosamine-6-sulfatase